MQKTISQQAGKVKPGEGLSNGYLKILKEISANDWTDISHFQKETFS